MNSIKTTLSFLLLLILFFPSFSVYGQSFEEQLVFHHITDRQGLSQRTVRAILQDSEGFIWLGTQDGLNKYDSYNMTVYRLDLQNPNSLPFDEIRAIFEDSRGNLWFGGWGLSRYNREKDHFYHYNYDYLEEADELWRVDTAINSLGEDDQGNLLIGSDNGLAVLDIDKNVLAYQYADASRGDTLSHPRITEIFKDSKGNVWIGTRNG
ncbi:two-component regulator propeller domain-containing protein, partial [Balneolaceae bacterium ANBcel3]|nr:two-component regulator propeller domain-containing protein [Balneolaceae bacterium ANBcel3]